MTVHAVTARKRTDRRYYKLRMPSKKINQPVGRMRRPGLQPLTPKALALRQAASRTATKRLAVLLLGRASPLPIAGFIAAWTFYNRKVDPPGFPGFDNISPGWRNPVQAPLGYAPGDFIPNPFDHRGAYGDGWEALVDTNECQLPQGCRYWGDFPSASVGNPYPDARPGLNWPTVPTMVPTAPLTSPIPASRPDSPAESVMPATLVQHPRRHRVLPNLHIGVNDLFWDDGLMNNIAITITLPLENARPGSWAAAGFFRMQTNAPNKKQKEKKMRSKKAFTFMVLKRIANLFFEGKEWTDILAEAAGFRAWRQRMTKGFKRVGSRRTQKTTRPGHFRKVGVSLRERFADNRTEATSIELGQIPALLLDGKHENLLKIFYLFNLDGLNNIDFELLAELVIENEIEDRIYGIAGRMSKSVAQASGAPLGPQFGKVM